MLTLHNIGFPFLEPKFSRFPVSDCMVPESFLVPSSQSLTSGLINKQTSRIKSNWRYMSSVR